MEIIFGQRVEDPYRWLEQPDSKRTRSWVAAQSARSRRALDALPGRPVLRRRLEELSYVEWISAPLRRGQRYFFDRQHPDREKVVHYFREGRRGKPRVLIDPNTLSTDGSLSVQGISVSLDGRKAAYKISLHNADTSTLHVMDVGSGEVSTVDTIGGARYAYPSWTPAGDGFYYTRLPEDRTIPPADLPGHAAVFFHRLGQDPETDELIHPETGDPRTFISADLSRDGRFLLLYIHHGWSRTDVYYKELGGQGRKPFVPFAVGQEALYQVFAWKERFYILTNEGAPRYRMFKAHARRPGRKHWQEIVPERKEEVLDGFSLVGGHLALRYLSRASTRIEITTLQGRPVRTLPLPELGTASGMVGNPEDDTAYLSFSSYLVPPTVYRTSLRRGGLEVHYRQSLPLRTSPFSVRQLHFHSPDRTRVSMFVVHREGLPLDGSTPFLLTGYGGFNISLTPVFTPRFLVWLEQGGGVAVANLRGGGEHGEMWHRAGQLTSKQNVFDDFIAASQTLIDRGYTRAARLAISGKSNGGLLVGAAMTQRPDLYRAVACHVPLLDMVRYHLSGSGKTWISEYGSADQEEQFRALHAYSPYHRVRPGTRYPALLMLSADSDDRVDPMHARKFTAAVQHATTSGLPVLLRMEARAGHAGGDMVRKRVDLETDELAFLMHFVMH